MMPVEMKYTPVAAALHWITVVLVCLLYGLGWFMTDLSPGPDRGLYFAAHKSLGLTLALVMVLRLGWRIANPPPPLQVVALDWRAQLAEIIHFSFYVLLFAQPLAGYLSSSFSGYDTSWFGYPLPTWGWEDALFNKIFTVTHKLLSIVILACIVLHVIGTMTHVYSEGWSFLRRIRPW